MSDIQKYEYQLPLKFASSLVESFFNNTQGDDLVQLTITIEGTDIAVKGLSDYLYFIYKTDGMLSGAGMRSYSKTYDEQITISKVEFGSISLIVEKVISEHGTGRLIVIWLALKYLPAIIEKGLSSANAFYDVLIKREEYLEKKNRRKERNYIRELVREEAELARLDSKSQEKLVDILDEVYLKNATKLKATASFSREKVKSTTLISKRRK